jgi:hypothetical protein
MLVKAGDFAQRVVSAAMGVAGEVIQRFELAEDERKPSERKETGLIMLYCRLQWNLLIGTITN